jgi:hypothetical protein
MLTADQPFRTRVLWLALLEVIWTSHSFSLVCTNLNSSFGDWSFGLKGQC